MSDKAGIRYFHDTFTPLVYLNESHILIHKLIMYFGLIWWWKLFKIQSLIY